MLTREAANIAYCLVATIDQHESPRGAAVLTLAIEGEEPYRGRVALRALTVR